MLRKNFFCLILVYQDHHKCKYVNIVMIVNEFTSIKYYRDVYIEISTFINRRNEFFFTF